MKKQFLAMVATLLTAILLFAPSTQADEDGDGRAQKMNQNSLQAHSEDPGLFAMTGDLLLARPALLVVTIVGTIIFVVSSPFSAAGGNIDQAAEKLIREPARATFVRCLGCSYKEPPDL